MKTRMRHNTNVGCHAYIGHNHLRVEWRAHFVDPHRHLVAVFILLCNEIQKIRQVQPQKTDGIEKKSETKKTGRGPVR